MHRPIGSLWRFRIGSPAVKSDIFRVVKNTRGGHNLCEIIVGMGSGGFETLGLDDQITLWELVPQESPEGI